MFLLTKQKYFYYIALLLMTTTYLPLVGNNLPPIIRSHHLYTVIWGLSLLVLYPKIFFTKTMLGVLSYGIFVFIATKTFWSNMNEWNFKMLFTEYYNIAVGVSVFTFFSNRKEYIYLAKLTRWILIFLIITAIMTIISSAIDPMYARNLIGVSRLINEEERNAVLNFKNFGGGNYSTAAAFMCFFPILFYFYKNIELSIVSKKIIIFISILFFIALLSMQIFGNIIIAFIFGILAIIGMKRLQQSILVMSLFFLFLFIIPKGFYINSLKIIGEYFNKDSELNYKFNDMAMFIESGAEIDDLSTGTGSRAARYPELMEAFLQSPLLGCFYLTEKENNNYSEIGGHLHWMNKITTTGIVGIFFFFFILYNFIIKNLKLFNPSFKLYYILASLSIISYGLMKTIVGKETWYAFFIILPGMYYLQLLKNNRIKK